MMFLMCLLLDARRRMHRIPLKANSNEAGNQQQRPGCHQTKCKGHSGLHTPNWSVATGASGGLLQRDHPTRVSGEPSGQSRTARNNHVSSFELVQRSKFGEAVKLRGSSLPLVDRFVTPLNCHQDNR